LAWQPKRGTQYLDIFSAENYIGFAIGAIVDFIAVFFVDFVAVFFVDFLPIAIFFTGLFFTVLPDIMLIFTVFVAVIVFSPLILEFDDVTGGFVVEPVVPCANADDASTASKERATVHLAIVFIVVCLILL
jgi:hypothetical protein